ncbi:MAG: DUF1156 domain-containing protein, partial [Pirellulaceae bacterium]|nr:DUF1156 domain-containing protein [Pirellulaceae bacterium]
FTSRQALSLETLGHLARTAPVNSPPDLAVAIRTCLALAVDRLADFNASLCVLNSVGGRGVVHVFGRQALPMVWDFMETNPFNTEAANWRTCYEVVDKVIKNEGVNRNCGTVSRANAAQHPLPDDSAAAFVTDPPYYDAVPYADLSDFFYVWLRRNLPAEHGSLIARTLTEKEQECIVDPVRKKDRDFFEQNMRAAMSEGRRVLQPNGVGIVVFAHKSTAGWETQIQAMVDAGWIVTGSWPIDTERPGRLRAQGSAALASSVHLVCRPRENPDGSVRTNEVGDWRDVLTELPRRIHEWMPRLAEEGVVGADAIFACLGPALEIYSRYSRVETASGEVVPLGDQLDATGKVVTRGYLSHVWEAVAKEALSMIFAGANAEGFEPDGRLTAMWLWTLSTGGNGSTDAGSTTEDEADEEEEETGGKAKLKGGFVLEYDAARKIAQGLGARLEGLVSLIEVKGDKARLLPVAERTKHLFGKDEDAAPAKRRKKKAAQRTFFESLDEVEEEQGGWGEKNVPELGNTVLDRVHQSMILFAAGRSEALKRFLVEDGVGRDARYWRLAQALSALYPTGTDEKRWVDGVLARKKGLGF